MPRIRLSRYEAVRGDLPAVCMCCGKPADEAPKRTFTWVPQWVLIAIVAPAIFLILALVLMRRMTIRTPLCNQHLSYWRKRSRFIWIGLGVLVCVMFWTIGVVNNDQHAHLREKVLPWVCLGTFVLGLIWLIVAAVIQANTIRPTKITEEDIYLTGVCQEFADAVREELIETVEPEDEVPLRRRFRPERRRDDEEPDDRLRTADRRRD
jgi:hypothetical protein